MYPFFIVVNKMKPIFYTSDVMKSRL